MVLYILRGAFILLAATVTALYVIPFQNQRMETGSDFGVGQASLMIGVTVGFAAAIVAIDMFTRRKGLAALSGVFLGLLGGLLAAYAASFVIDLIVVLRNQPISPEADAKAYAEAMQFEQLMQGVKVFIGLITCYLGISLVMQTKDDFRFVIPYVEFAKEMRGMRPTLLDTSILIDGRIIDVIDTHIIQGSLLVPRFVLNELQLVADSSDKLRRARGRRGLDVLQQLQASAVVEVSDDDQDVEGATVDQKLVTLAQKLRARLMTNDFNLAKVASVRGVDVINLNEVAKSLRPVVLPGEAMDVKVVKPGENAGQGVGYLADGTMVVIESARRLVGETVPVVVTSTLQTSAGRMIFGRVDDETADTSRGSKDAVAAAQGSDGRPSGQGADDRQSRPS